MPHLADLAQTAREKREHQATTINNTEILVKGKTDQYLILDLCGARVKLKVPPYTAKDDWPAARVEWSGEAFYTHKADEVIRPFFKFLLEEGAEVDRANCKRLDIAVDLGGVGVEVFHKAEAQERFITHAKQSMLYKNSRRVNTLYFGKKPVMLRIYDKWAQLLHERNPHKSQSYEMRMGGVYQTARVEFQVRKEKLKAFDFAAHTLDGALTGWGRVAKYCATDFCRMVQKRTTKTTSNKLTKEWERVLHAIETGGDNFAAGDAYEAQAPDVVNLMRSAAGTLATAARNSGLTFESSHDMKMQLVEMLDRFLSKEERDALFIADGKKRLQVMHQRANLARS